ncbi:C6 transcription factor, putative [Talaromyces stipitatus ATCC 10500]|uniref:C6 transcription factor, putative n=1 Tax=Talaromyces stipitatus (strain ATCC 10500 / CBS 375.48 / QM 6759 / NRRL 1006) TaxID=441959 RepID=B8MQD3_TALSN|nr:C6 transcription factor, putative [Talaromyces stipitatus ATCC 10500]EED13335.1 C6 transcription factor, putative [Talaromyces stipitatus ATCC 10500]
MVLSEVQPSRTIRPHTKSRQGCLNCKARRVKCQETRPQPYYNCASRSVECVYPPENQLGRRRNGSRRNSDRKGPSRLDSLSSTSTIRQDSAPSEVELRSHSFTSPNTFIGEDFRFFHHFLITAYPHLPFQSEELWKTSLPAYAHECPHLMHAILCLGASHLSLISPKGDTYTTLAVEHLGSALTTGDRCTRTELDLILATTYALTFQASYMIGGLTDFAFMVRGCAIITRHILNQYQRSEMFDLLMPEDVYAHVWPRLSAEPCYNPEILDTCIQTLESLQPLLQQDSHQLTYQAISSTYRTMKISAREGFIAFTFVYSSWEHMSNQEFMDFLDTSNHVSSLLLLHFVTVTIMMRPVFGMLRPSILETSKDALANHQWGANIYESLPEEFRGFVEWQYRFIAADKACIESEGTIHAIHHNNDHLML